MPDISADGKQVIAVQVGTDQQWFLRLINADNGKQYNQPNPNQYSYTYPKFSADNTAVISAVRNAVGEMALLQTDLSTKEETILLPFTNTPIGYLQVAGDTILFTAAQKEGDVLFLYDLKNKSFEARQ